MAFPQSHAGAVSRIATGAATATTTAQQLGKNLPCRRILLVADTGQAGGLVVAQGQPATGGMPIPQVQVDGNFAPLELWVNSPNVVWIVTASGTATLRWYAELT